MNENNNTWVCAFCTLENSGFLPFCESCARPNPSQPAFAETVTPENKWKCIQCTFFNDQQSLQCTVCSAARDKNILFCDFCTTPNDISCKLCMVCNKICDPNKFWQCSKCSFVSPSEVNCCSVCSTNKDGSNNKNNNAGESTEIIPKATADLNFAKLLQTQDIWMCDFCGTQNDISAKLCFACEQIRDAQQYWKCSRCSFVSGSEFTSCSVCGASKDGSAGGPGKDDDSKSSTDVSLWQRYRPPSNAVVTLDRKVTGDTTIILAADNAQQHENFQAGKEIIEQLSSTSLVVSGEFIEHNMAQNNVKVITTLMDVLQKLAEFMNLNNEEIRHEMKAVIECQLYQPSEEKMNQESTGVWKNLNLCVKEFCAVGNQFLDVRDGFIAILMEIMWKPQSLKINSETVAKLKQIVADYALNANGNNNNNNNNNNNEIVSEDDDDRKCLFFLNKVSGAVIGLNAFKCAYNSHKSKADEHNQIIDDTNAKIEEFNGKVRGMNDGIEAEVSKYKQKVKTRDDYYEKHIAAHGNKQYDQAKTYGQQFKAVEAEFKIIITGIEQRRTNAKTFCKNFEAIEKAMKDKLEVCKREYEHIINEIKSGRQKTSIAGDNNILEFLEKLERLKPLALRIISRMKKFKVVLATMSELIVRNSASAENNDIPIEWYFAQEQVNLKVFVPFFHERKQVFYIKDLVQFSGDTFKNVILPELEDFVHRKLVRGEKRRLKKLCNPEKKKKNQPK